MAPDLLLLAAFAVASGPSSSRPGNAQDSAVSPVYADGLMQSAYFQLRERLDSPEAKSTLLESQREWLSRRARTCRVPLSRPLESITLTFLEARCITALSLQRTLALLDTSDPDRSHIDSVYQSIRDFSYGEEVYLDLNRDGETDTVRVEGHGTGGSGVFMFLAARVSYSSGYRDARTKFEEDRIFVDSLVVRDSTVVLYYVGHGPDDPACCPSLPQVAAFGIDDFVPEDSATEVSPKNTGENGNADTAIASPSPVGFQPESRAEEGNAGSIVAPVVMPILFVLLLVVLAFWSISPRRASELQAASAADVGAQCSNCGKLLGSEVREYSDRLYCPACYAAQIPSWKQPASTDTSPNDPEPPPTAESPRPEQHPSNLPMPQPAGRVPCPWCAEEILPAAKICRYCQRETGFDTERVVPSAPAQSSVDTLPESDNDLPVHHSPKALIDGAALALRSTERLAEPRKCSKCEADLEGARAYRYGRRLILCRRCYENLVQPENRRPDHVLDAAHPQSGRTAEYRSSPVAEAGVTLRIRQPRKYLAPEIALDGIVVHKERGWRSFDCQASTALGDHDLAIRWILPYWLQFITPVRESSLLFVLALEQPGTWDATLGKDERLQLTGPSGGSTTQTGVKTTKYQPKFLVGLSASLALTYGRGVLRWASRNNVDLGAILVGVLVVAAVGAFIFKVRKDAVALNKRFRPNDTFGAMISVFYDWTSSAAVSLFILFLIIAAILLIGVLIST